MDGGKIYIYDSTFTNKECQLGKLLIVLFSGGLLEKQAQSGSGF